ncbi:CopG family transcriptional regulator [Clostridia bacterium]|nr:CopG family transcriptional regulator [Clostridia bacterium]
MQKRVAIVGIISKGTEKHDKINGILHEYADYIIGRMGLPYREKGINIISVAVDAPQDITSALSGKIGKLEGVSVKAVYANE